MTVEFIPKTPPIYQTQLAFELAPADMTATFASELMIDGNLLSGLICVSVDIGQPNPEYIIGTLSGTTFTITLRNVAPLDPTVSTGAFTSTHGQGAVVKITDFATIQIMRNILSGTQALQNPLVSLANAVLATDVPNFGQLTSAVIAGGLPASTTVMGLSRISASPNVTIGTATITIATPAVITSTSHGLTVNDIIQFTTTGVLPTGISVGTNYYVIATGLTANAFEISTTAGGSAVNTSGTQSGTHTLIKETPVSVGTNDTRLPTQGENDALVGNNTDIAVGTGNKMVTQTGLIHNAEKYAVDGSSSSTAYTATLAPIPTSLTDGMVVYVKINQTNSTTAPTLNVNALGAKTIKKLGNVAVAVGDVIAGFNTFIYDLTNTVWILQNPIANVISFSSTAGTGSAPASSSTQTITHGLGRAPINIDIESISDLAGSISSSQSAFSKGSFNASGNICLYIASIASGTGVGPATSSSFAIRVQNSGAGNIATGVIGNVTSTTYDIVWTAAGDVSGQRYYWKTQ